MAGNEYYKGHASTSKAPGNDTAWSGESAGPYIGVIKNNVDPLRMGRLQVNIPSLSKTNDPISGNLITCEYLSPFYGSKDARHSIPGSTDYKDSQHSYGFWAVPPDIGTRVLVIFAEGKMDQAFWIGCVPEPMTNQMTPGISSSRSTHDALDGTFEGADAGFQDDKQTTYGTTNVPSGEVNRTNAATAAPQNFNNIKKPIHPFAETLLKQGLSADDIRGNTSSSARRESPSAVFGISTPGRKDTGTTRVNVGTKDAEVQDYVTRQTGHTFVMDDGAVDGTNQLTRLRTASGHQLLMHDTEGVVYIANGSGNAYIEMNSDGRIDLYSGVGGINMRTQGDFNLHSDTNINMHAGGQIRMSATNEIVKSAGSYMLNLGDKGIFNSSQKGSIRDYARDGLSSFTDGTQLHGAGGRIDLAGAQVHLNSVGASPVWGPTWLNTDAAGMTERQEGDVELAKKGIEPLRSFTKQTSTTVHRFVTHEPMPRFRGFTSEGAMPTGGADNKKQWYRLASTPGTVEYTEYQLMLSPNESIRQGIFQAQAERHLREQMGTSTDPAKARKILADFGKEYDDLFGINASKVAWDTATSISNKLKGFDVADSVAEVLNNTTKKLADQVIDTVTGSEAAELFKDNVFVNQAGELFALGDKTQLFSGDFKGFATDVGSKALANTANDTFQKAVGDLTKRKAIGVDKFGNTVYQRSVLPSSIAGIDISGLAGNIAGNINIANIRSIADLKATTQVFKNVVAGQVTSTIQTTAINAIASQAKGFVQGLGGSTARELGAQGIKAGRFTNLGSKIGAMKLPGGGSVTAAFTAVKTFFGGFSDVRLKEDIRLIGRSPSGINIYEFKYKHTSGTWQGVMAQEVPWARTMTDTGYYMVDYTKVDVEFRRLN
jgi:hypothetical protein